MHRQFEERIVDVYIKYVDKRTGSDACLVYLFQAEEQIQPHFLQTSSQSKKL